MVLNSHQAENIQVRLKKRALSTSMTRYDVTEFYFLQLFFYWSSHSKRIFFCNCVLSREEHLKIVAEVLSKFKEAGMRLIRSKCQFMLQSGEYLGHIIDNNGLRPFTDKVNAIINAAP